MEEINLKKDQKENKHGGVRPGAGRPRGAYNKTSWGELLQEFERVMGLGFHEVAVQNYLEAKQRADHELVFKYDRLILNKLAPDLHAIELTDNRVESARQAFEAALQDLQERPNVK
jgi:hypothetical protein